MKDAHLTLRLPDALARELERAAEARGVPKSMIVREAVAKYLVEPNVRPARRGMTGAELARIWATGPHLTPQEAEDFARDIEKGRAELLPLDDPWE